MPIEHELICYCYTITADSYPACRVSINSLKHYRFAEIQSEIRLMAYLNVYALNKLKRSDEL